MRKALALSLIKSADRQSEEKIDWDRDLENLAGLLLSLAWRNKGEHEGRRCKGLSPTNITFICLVLEMRYTNKLALPIYYTPFV